MRHRPVPGQRRGTPAGFTDRPGVAASRPGPRSPCRGARQSRPGHRGRPAAYGAEALARPVRKSPMCRASGCACPSCSVTAGSIAVIPLPSAGLPDNREANPVRQAASAQLALCHCSRSCRITFVIWEHLTHAAHTSTNQATRSAALPLGHDVPFACPPQRPASRRMARTGLRENGNKAISI